MKEYERQMIYQFHMFTWKMGYQVVYLFSTASLRFSDPVLQNQWLPTVPIQGLRAIEKPCLESRFVKCHTLSKLKRPRKPFSV